MSEYYRIISILIGAALDLMIGDPQWMPHPVRWIGSLIALLEGRLRRAGDPPRRQRWKGALLVLIVLAVTGGAAWGLLRLMYRLHPAAGIAAEAILCCYALAARNLGESAMAVYKPLIRGDVEGARAAVSMIVGRDTSVLDEDGIIRAAVETVAENTADGVIAPMLYLFLGGAVGGMLYKAVNTMDSMLGYQNTEYRYFGTAAARLDDAAGFVPARISALCLMAAALLIGQDAAGARRIYARDRRRHKSPNAGQSESVMAGALGVRLAGDAVYFGRVEHKPYIGDPVRPIEAEDIPRAVRMMYAASGICLAACTAIAWICVRVLI